MLGSAIGPGHRDYEMSKNLVKLWVSFARGDKYDSKELSYSDPRIKYYFFSVGTSTSLERNLLNFIRMQSKSNI